MKIWTYGRNFLDDGKIMFRAHKTPSPRMTRRPHNLTLYLSEDDSAAVLGELTGLEEGKSCGLSKLLARAGWLVTGRHESRSVQRAQKHDFLDHQANAEVVLLHTLNGAKAGGCSLSVDQWRFRCFQLFERSQKIRTQQEFAPSISMVLRSFRSLYILAMPFIQYFSKHALLSPVLCSSYGCYHSSHCGMSLRLLSSKGWRTRE